MYAKDLEPYFVNKQETTLLTFQLHYILSNLIKDYAADHLEEFNKTTFYYEDLVGDINFKFLKLDKTHEKRVITEKDIIRLCFPNKDPENDKVLIEGKINKKKLSVIYRYFDELNSTLYHRGGSYWIEELIKSEQSTEKYSDPIQPSQDKKTIKTADEEFTMDGAITINSAFRQTVDAQNTYFEVEDFYLSKNQNYCQWNGVIQGLVEEREICNSVEDAVAKSFAQRQENIIAAVVTGARGSGKSSLLRKLAIDSIEQDFITLWITNLELFLLDYNKLLQNGAQQYLVIIEDWENLASYLDVNSFFAKLKNLENIRIIIGDTTTIGRGYLDYFSERHTYPLSVKENKTILEKILVSNSKWALIGETLLSNSKLLDSSLFVVLFIIGKKYLETDTEQVSLTQVGDLETRFKAIIRHDQNIIAKTYPGLAIALHYWASVLKNLTPLISWDAFLQIADEFNGDEKISSRLMSFPDDNHICKILRSYISVEPSISFLSKRANEAKERIFSMLPSLAIKSFENVNVFNFHHDLIKEAFSYPLYEHWPQFDNAIKIELIDILIKKGRLGYASELRHHYLKRKNFCDIAQNSKYNNILKDIKPFSLLRLQAINYYYDVMNAFLEEIRKAQNEQESNEVP